jgi:hypothetical protein
MNFEARQDRARVVSWRLVSVRGLTGIEQKTEVTTGNSEIEEPITPRVFN